MKRWIALICAMACLLTVGFVNVHAEKELSDLMQQKGTDYYFLAGL